MSHLTDSQLKELKASLTERKKELEQHFSQNGEGILGDSLKQSTGEISSVDNHPADAGTETFERSRDLAINNSLNEELADIEAALARLADGTYGICIASKEEIPYERLKAIPHTVYSIEHTPKQEISNARPAEEDVMTAPPAGAGEGRQANSGKFDDAGAWETVEDYGNSNSPAMSAKRDVTSYEDV